MRREGGYDELCDRPEHREPQRAKKHVFVFDDEI